MIFVGGLSGSGKTVAAARSGVTPVLSLDAFFKDDHPSLPRWLRRTDWETVDSYDLEGAVAAVLGLASGRAMKVPIYDHHDNARVDSTTLNGSATFVAEGVHAPEVYEAVRETGVPARLLHIQVPARDGFLDAYLARHS